MRMTPGSLQASSSRTVRPTICIVASVICRPARADWAVLAVTRLTRIAPPLPITTCLGGEVRRDPLFHDRLPAKIGEDVSVLRAYTAADQASVRDLILEGMKERWGDAYDPAFNADLDDISGTYVDRGAEVVVVEREGAVIATGTLIPDADAAGRIVRVAVARSHRRLGLGRLVVNELVRRAQARAMGEVRVLTDTPWASAVELYLSTGFIKVADDGRDVHLVRRL